MKFSTSSTIFLLVCVVYTRANNQRLPTAEIGEITNTFLAKSALEIPAEKGDGDFAVDTDSSVDKEEGQGIYVFTYRTKGDVGDDPFKLCGFYDQTDVRGPLIDNGLRKEGTEAVALLTQTSFTENEYLYTLVDKDASRIEFRDLLHIYGKRWAHLQIQKYKFKPPYHSPPIIYGNVCVQTDKTFPIDLIRKALNETMEKFVKVWLEVAPKVVPEDPK
ncbi:uncharacterized protein LOC124200958 isoform X1 [Daphnia pulex]|uniref:uncharacterized protein LOC124200958 isoform X1 n=1 Tax=Daphnia pulex TaxID=6669 RepID=UPI001EDF74DF|nr:uncharacterized protein LOC124200958 isoform X1 [Daphnia pulex]